VAYVVSNKIKKHRPWMILKVTDNEVRSAIPTTAGLLVVISLVKHK